MRDLPGVRAHLHEDERSTDPLWESLRGKLLLLIFYDRAGLRVMARGISSSWVRW